MCGIAGIWNHAGDSVERRTEIMLDAMQHRGPDGRGMLQFDGGAAGMVRLALVDLSDRGQQPLWSPDRRVAILYNGEVYNFREERARLEAGGYQFQSTTDTEVVLALYLERGLEFVERLRGMYAVAIFDWRETQPEALPKLVLARDPLGIKPLYITPSGPGGEGIAFSSELRALLRAGLAAPRLDREGALAFLTFGFLLQPRTMIEGVRMLEPGTLECYAPGQAPVKRRFWEIPPYEPREESLDESAERLRAALNESIRIHALADAPVGAFLSGGVDSTAVVALMRRENARLRTYTVRYPDLPGRDEAEESIEGARRFDCEHTVIDVANSEVESLFRQFAAELDQPSVDGFNTWIISRGAARDVKGVLSGLGGDEWFAGYPVTKRMQRYGRAPQRSGRAMVAGIMRSLERLLPEGRIRERVESMAAVSRPLELWALAHRVFSIEQGQRMLGRSTDGTTLADMMAQHLAGVRDDYAAETPIGLSCLLDVSVFMGSRLLLDSDVTSMAHSLELRTPFVDIEIAKFARSCRDDYRLASDEAGDGRYSTSGAKKVLIHALKDILPPTIGQRVKRGFFMPYAYWLEHNMPSVLEQTCTPEALRRRDLIAPEAIGGFLNHPRSFASPYYPKLWCLAVLELWCQSTLDQQPQMALVAA